MFTDQNVAFIGGGIMGEAMIRGLITRDIVAPEQIIVADPMAERLDDLRGRYGIRATVSNAEAAESGPVSYTHHRAQETVLELVCRLLLEKKKTTVNV